DARGGYVSLGEYEEWIRSLADRLDSTIAPSPAFQRFAQALPAPNQGCARPQNILFDFAEIIGANGDEVPEGWDSVRTQSLAHADRCIDVGDDGNLMIEVDGQQF